MMKVTTLFDKTMNVAGKISATRLKVAVGIVAIGMLNAACVSEAPLVQEASRAMARSAVDAAAAQYLPGVNVSPFSNCVINNASTGELISLAKVAAAGNAAAAEAWPVVRDIMKRPATTDCLVQALSASELIRMGAATL